MPNQLKEGTSRVSYVESNEVHYALKIMAAYKGVSISALMRQATLQYLEGEDSSGVVLDQAKKALSMQSDSPKERATDGMDPQILEIAKVLHKKLTK
jgi:hypothetical protein